MTHDQFDVLARRAGAAVRLTTLEVPMTLTDITGPRTETSTRPRRGPLVFAAAGLVLVLLATAAVAWSTADGEVTQVAPPAERTTTLVLDGTSADVTLEHPQDWMTEQWGLHVLHQDQIEPAASMPGVVLDPEADGVIPGARVTVLATDTVMSTVPPMTAQEPVPADIVTYLESVPGLAVGAAEDVTVDGRPALQVDLGMAAATSVDDPTRAELFCIGSEGNYCHPVEAALATTRYVVVPVDGGAVVVAAEAGPAGSTAAYEALDATLAGLRIDAG